VEALEADPPGAARLLAEFAKQCIDRAEVAQLAGQDPFSVVLPTRADAVLFLFVRGDSRFDDTETTEGYRTMLLLRASRWKSDVAGPDAQPGMRRLFLRWLAAERQTDEMDRAFEIARRAGLAEALPLALKAATDPKKHGGYRAGLLLDYVAAVGGREHVKSLAPLLKDDGGLGSLKVGDGPTLAPEIRDIALAVSIRLAGQDPAEFGFRAGAFADKEYHKYYEGYGFIDSAARSAAHAKWEAWLQQRETPGKK
jgi:hypothetical protein